MTNRSIARRAGIVAAAPLAGLLAMSAHNLSESRDALQSARITEAAASLLPEICAFLHAIQMERSAATAIPAAPAANQTIRRAQTDAAAGVMIALIQHHLPTLEGDGAAAALATLRIAESVARERAELRALVDSGASSRDVTLAYSAIVDRLLGGIVRLRQEAPNQVIANDVLSLISQLRISELAGLERSEGAAALARGGFTPDGFIAFNSLSLRQDAMLDGLGMWVSPDVFVAIDEALATPQARDFVTLRTALLDGRGAVPKDFATPRAWTDLAGARIRALSAAENQTIARLSAALADARRAAQMKMRNSIAAVSTLGALLAMAGMMISATARRVLACLIGANPNAHPAAGQAPGGSSAMMIVDSNGVVAFITPGLDEALLRSTKYFSARRPNAEFKTIKGQNVDLFDTAAPGGFRDMLSEIVDGPAGELRFDERRFSIVSSRVTGSSGKPGHVVEWVERARDRGAKPGFGFGVGMALLGRRSA